MKNAVITYNAKLTESGATLNEGLKPAKTFTIPDITEFNIANVNVPTGSSDLEQSLNLVDQAKFLIIETDETISVKLDSSSNTAIPIVASGTPKTGLLILTPSGINSLFFANASGNNAKVGLFFGS